jgi:hypothetical protein
MRSTALPVELPSLETVRARAQAHQHEIDVRVRFLTVQQLADRWGCSDATVRAIPADRLPYVAIGTVHRRTHRRYDPQAVDAYEKGRGYG